MGWLPEVEEIVRRREMALRMGGLERVARHHSAGKLTIRERVESLLDPGTFREVGSLAGQANYDSADLKDFTPANFVTGVGKIDGRMVVVGGEDFTIAGGAVSQASAGKSTFFEKMALEWRLPIIRLIDGTGGGGMRDMEERGHTFVSVCPDWELHVALLQIVPCICAALGTTAGLPAVKVAVGHFCVMVRGTSQIFVAGPPVVKRSVGVDLTKEEIGGAAIHQSSGAVDNVAEDEEDALRQIRRFLSYLPTNVWQQPPYHPPDDDPQRREEELLSIIPRDRTKGYDPRRLLELVFDRGSIFELGRYFGPSQITCFARLDGYPVGVLANDPTCLGGSMDGAAADKMARFVDTCDTFHLPVVNLMDQPGLMVGPDAEREATVRRGARALFAVYQATVPWVVVLLKRCYGVGGATHGNGSRVNLRYAWPSGEWGGMPIEGGVTAAFRRDIESSPDPEARRRQIEERFIQLRNPFRTAEAFGVEEIIDPRDTRPLLCEFVHLAYEITRMQLGPKLRGPRP